MTKNNFHAFFKDFLKAKTLDQPFKLCIHTINGGSKQFSHRLAVFGVRAVTSERSSLGQCGHWIQGRTLRVASTSENKGLDFTDPSMLLTFKELSSLREVKMEQI